MTFVKGQSGNPAGRTPGSKNKISEKFITAITADFEQHGETVIAKVRSEKPENYLKIVADLVPKDFNIEGNVGLTVTLRNFTLGNNDSERVDPAPLPDATVDVSAERGKAGG